MLKSLYIQTSETGMQAGAGILYDILRREASGVSADRFGDLEEQYDKIYRYCYFRLKNRERAEDITQEAFLRFWESEGYRDTGKALRYLYTIARNLCIDDYRKMQKEPVSAQLQPEKLAAIEAARGREAYEEAVCRMDMQDALSGLSGTDRELLLLRYVNQLPVSVVGSLLGISRFAVYRRTAGALKALRERLGEE